MHRITHPALIAILVTFTIQSTSLAQRQIAPPPPAPMMDLWGITALDSLRLIAVGDYGIFRWSTDGGITWTHRLSESQFAFRNIMFFDSTVGIAAGFWSTLFRTIDAGRNWAKIDLHQDLHLPGLALVGPRHAWLSGAEGCVLRSTDAGVTWTRMQTGVSTMLDAISFADSLHGWCSSVQGSMLRSTDGGESWTAQNLKTSIPVTSLFAQSASTCWAAGYNGLILKTDDGGETWNKKSGYTADFTRIQFDSKGTGWAVGKRGVVAYSSDGGEQWRLHHLKASATINAICFPADGKALTVGAAGSIEIFPTKPQQ